MSIGLRKLPTKVGRKTHEWVFNNRQSDEEHLKDAHYFVTTPDRIVGGRDDAQLQSRCARDLFTRAQELKALKRDDLAMNFAFGAAVLDGAPASVRDKSLSLYRGAHKRLRAKAPDVADYILNRNREGVLDTPSAGHAHSVHCHTSRELLGAFRGAILGHQSAKILSLPAASAPSVNPRPVVGTAHPDQLAVA